MAATLPPTPLFPVRTTMDADSPSSSAAPRPPSRQGAPRRRAARDTETEDGGGAESDGAPARSTTAYFLRPRVGCKRKREEREEEEEGESTSGGTATESDGTDASSSGTDGETLGSTDSPRSTEEETDSSLGSFLVDEEEEEEDGVQGRAQAAANRLTAMLGFPLPGMESEEDEEEAPTPPTEEEEALWTRMRTNLRARRLTKKRILDAPVSLKTRQSLFDTYHKLKGVPLYSEEWFVLMRDVDRQLKHPLTVEEAEVFDSLTPAVDTTSVPRRIMSLDASDTVKATLKKTWEQAQTVAGDHDKDWRILRYMLALPWNKRCERPLVGGVETEVGVEVKQLRAQLDAAFFGMASVKQALLLNHVMRRQGVRPHKTLLLVGAPGGGKTSILVTFAKLRAVPYARFQPGGRGAMEWIRGGMTVHVGSEPSHYLKALMATGVSDPVIIVDEAPTAFLQRPGVVNQGESSGAESAMLAILDPEHNDAVTDDYLTDTPHDLSRIEQYWTGNSADHLSRALRDRLEILHIPSYTVTQQQQIVRDWMLPKVLKTPDICTALERVAPSVPPAGAVTLSPDAAIALAHWKGTAAPPSAHEPSWEGRRGLRDAETGLHHIVRKLLTLAQLGPEGAAPLGLHLPDFRGLPYLVKESDLRVLLPSAAEAVPTYQHMYT